jgi:archaellum component FlaG (FlaF/FlaG flagellin family)
VTIQSNNTNRHNSALVILILLTTVLVSGFTTNVPAAVFADSKLLKQDTNQNASCDTVGADSPVSGSCDQSAANNVNNGVPKSAVTPETTGTLLVRFVCNNPICATARPSIVIIVSASTPPVSLTFTVSGSQLVTLNPGDFRILVLSEIGQDRSGDCDIGTIKAGQHLTCTIIAAP